MRPPLDGATALVTGASSGIGEAIARLLAPRVNKLVLVARRRDRLEALAAELARSNDQLELLVAPCDLCDRAAIDRMLDEVAAKIGDVDLLVNNAGFGDVGMFDLASWDKTEKLLELDVRAPAYLTHRLLGPMVRKRRGGILMISSGFGMTFLPGFSAYVGAKHFITGFSEALRLELLPVGVVVTQVCPGPVATEFDQTIGNFSGMSSHHAIQISAERCARAALRGFERGRAMVVPGWVSWLMIGLGRLTPRWMQRLLYRPAAKWFRGRQERALAKPT